MTSQIKAVIVADSCSAVNGKRITTFELEYPRFIHSELMTHRMFSRNAASSRAIPIEKMCDQVCDNPATPIHWGKNQAGMQAKEQVGDVELYAVRGLWEEQAQQTSLVARYMAGHGLHKQIVNRILEPFQLMKTVVTATEWENFFWLRKHEDAQPEIKELAERMWEALGESKAVELKPGEWHLPYVSIGRDGKGNAVYFLKGQPDTFGGLELDDALAISASCCAQVSYRLLDDSIEKARKVYQRLVESEPVHASPFEHQVTPMKEPLQSDKYLWEDGMTHADKDGNMWSGNLMGWIQHRQLIPNNVKRG